MSNLGQKNSTFALISTRPAGRSNGVTTHGRSMVILKYRISTTTKTSRAIAMTTIFATNVGLRTSVIPSLGIRGASDGTLAC